MIPSIKSLENFDPVVESLSCGLEIHQQLDGKKLFCECPALITDEPSGHIVKRKLCAVSGETGVVDVTALNQSLRGKLFLYECPPSASCLVDIDEEPPHSINFSALRTALHVSSLLKCSIVDEVQIMRKIVIDGSNTGGFQRSALIGMDGKIVSNGGGVGIQTVVLEEDSARLVCSSQSSVTYRLDRLGIPLLEIATAPEIHSPVQARDVAESIGLLIRATGMAKRGLGSIRQDVNISIAGGSRVEIKGAQDLRRISDIVTREMLRQRNILLLRDFLKTVSICNHQRVVLPNSSSKIVSGAFSKGLDIFGARVVNGGGVLGLELQPDKRVASELSDVAKEEVGIGGLIHSDELPNYGITDSEKKSIFEQLNCKLGDGFIFVLSDEFVASKSFDIFRKRLLSLQSGVPSEVRRALPDGSSSYLRVMPGSARLYPETDVLPVIISDDVIKNFPVVESYDDRVKRYVSDGLGRDLSVKLSRSDRCFLYDDLRVLENVNKPFIAEILIAGESLIKSELKKDVVISDETFCVVFRALDDSKITKKGVIPLLASSNPSLELYLYAPLSSSDIEETVVNILKSGEQMPLGVIIGKVMNVLKGRADGKIIAEIVQKYVKKK
ncbi:Glu-tRNA(Gln) amidotransferase subunit GatE [Candidatus Woesearchaeota archaeon]|nr:Glu-tRNA(Gln) amidotransferase subunit GatE [Candidatus Woesearchaeota archaeon]